ncbi:MAG TPA: SUMF1/EgtB/PvdO family nonheme iron enzyme [Thermotogota bacterium]|nr:SUMF1/EgtB/PvdO family nonheme iron enzyme [Thermotogota bacterium]HRW35621.1 SUMF1/EgtB/PvdO family nonheme iron enzyme [Thermotogota bacterium]
MGVKTKRQMIRFLIVLLIILFVSCVSKNDSPEIPGEIPTKALFEGQLGALPDEADKLIGEVEQIKEDLVIQNPFENVQMPGQKREILNETRITFLGVMHFEDFSSFHEYNIDVTYFQYTQVYRVENLSGTLDCKTYISTTDLGESPELSEIFENGYLLFNHLINLSGETVLTFDSLTSEGANEILQALNDSIDENQAISIYIYTIKTYNNFDDNTIIATDEAEVTITVDLNLEKENSLPTLEKISGPNGEMHEATSVFKWQGQDQDGHINSYKISKDGIEETIADTQATWTGYTEGEHVFSVQGTDNRGGLSNIIEWLFSLSPNQPPVVEKVSGPDNWESIDENSATFEWSGTDEMQGRDIKKYQIKKDEGNWQDIVPSDNTFYIWNDIEVDIHTFGVRAVDNNDAFSEVIEWYFNYGMPERTLLVKAIPGIGGDIQINNQGWRDIDEINLPEGVTVQLKAREAVGWKFMIWNQTDDLTGDFVPIFEKEFIYTMPDYNHELFAGFAQLCQVTAESSPNNGGKVKIDDGELTEKASKTVAEGTQVELEAVENDDYTFEGWVDDTGLVSVESQYSVTVNEDKDFKALFEAIAVYETVVLAEPKEGGDIQVGNGGWKDEERIMTKIGDQLSLDARAEEGWSFGGWYYTDANHLQPVFFGNDPHWDFFVEASNTIVEASFIREYDLTVESSPNNGGKVKIDDGELTEKASKTVAEGTQVELEAVENDDYTFEGWVDDTGLVSVESQYSVTVNEDKDFKALFEPQPEEFLLRVFANPAEGGDIELEDRGWKDEDNKQYKEGDPVELRAREAEGWQFIGWFYDNWQYPSDAISTDDVYFYTMEGTDITIRAEFIYMPTITVESSPNNGGKVKIDDGELTEKASKTVAEGTQVELEAVENDDYTFEGWVDDTGLVSVESPYSVTVNEDKDFKALFEAIAVYETVVLALPPEGGDIQVGNGGWKDEERVMTKIGDQLSLDARAEEGWRFVGWYYTDATEPQPLYYGNDPHWEFIVDASNTRIEAQFCREHTITAESSPNNGGRVKIDDGELTEKASKTVEEGTQVALEAVENEGYTFEGWVEDTGLVSVESQIWVIVEQDKLLTALFEPVEPLDEYNLIVRANPAKGGDIQIDDQGWKDEDTIIAVETALVPLHAREEPQWIFLGWYWGGQFYPMEAALSSNKDYDFQMVGYEADLEALFGFIPETVPIEGSIFTMGDTFDDGEPNEKPVHEVALVWDFSIGKYEVTNEQYVQFLNSAGVEYNDEDRWGYLNGRKIIDERYFEQTGIVYSPGWGWDLKGDHQGTVYDYGQMPVINVTWFGAVEYCNWLSEINGMYPAYEWDEDKQTYILNDYPPNPGYRLPTEAEWEYTARGGQNRVDNGNQWAGTSDDNCREDYGWFEDNSNRMPQPVGGKLPNEVGTYDMSGNAIEWTSDVYREYSPGSETCPYHPGEDGQENPHVARGGGFDWNDYNSTVCARFIEMNNLWSTPLQLDYVGGFRIAKSE